MIASLSAAGLPALKALAVLVFAGGLGALTGSVMADPDNALHRAWSRYCGSLEMKLYRAFVFRPGHPIALMQLVGLVGALAMALLTSVPRIHCALLAVLIAALPPLYLSYQLRQRVAKIDTQVEGFLVAVANALKSRPAVGDAIASVLALTPLPLRQELELSVKQMRLGSSVEQALVVMGSRVGSKQLDLALSALLIGWQVGGNLPTIIETTAAAMREMARLEGVVRTKTAEGKAQMWVLAVFPVLLMVAFNAVSHGYFDALSESIWGYIATTVAFVCWGASIVVARKILAVDI